MPRGKKRYKKRKTSLQVYNAKKNFLPPPSGTKSKNTTNG